MLMRERLSKIGFSNVEREFECKTAKAVKFPRGIRNNNPFNIKDSAQHWQGELLDGFDPVYEEFQDVLSGLRAGFRVLRTYRDKHGLLSIEAIIKRFAPVSENDPVNYINYVAQRSLISANAVLQAYQYLQVADAMIVYEQGYNPFCTAIIVAAWFSVFDDAH